ncbi:MAG: hypothetical protein ACLS6O_07575 [Bifidobacterium sp.]
MWLFPMSAITLILGRHRCLYRSKRRWTTILGVTHACSNGTEAAPKHANHQHRAPRQDAVPQQGQPNADPWSQQFSAPAQPMPQVAAEDDEYSMSDESIGASTALSVDDLTRLFEVKSRGFRAGRCKNPRNMQQKKNLDD